MATVTTRTSSATGPTERSAGLDRALEELAGGRDVVWVDLDDPAPADLQRLAAELALHHLAVEDALGPHQRGKYVHYRDHRFLVVHAVELDGEMAPAPVEFDVFVGDGWLVTVHRGGVGVVERMVARWEAVRELAGGRVGAVLYAILGVVVDGYAGVLDRFEDFYDAAAERVFGRHHPDESQLRRKFETRKALDRFTRQVEWLAEAVALIVDDDLARYGPASAPYLRDVRSDLVRLVAELHGMRGLVGQLLDADLLLRDHRQNVVMKKVTSWAAIIAVPTLVTGYYGMNVPFPGDGETWGVVTSSALAAAGSIALYVLFRRRRWL